MSTAGIAPVSPIEGWRGAAVRLGYKYDVTLGKMLDAGKRVAKDAVLLPYLRAANLQDSGLATDDVNAMPYTPEEAARLDLRAGDLLVVEGGAVGTAVRLDDDLPGWSFQKTVNRVRSRGDASTRVLAYVLRTYRDMGYFNMLCAGSTIAHLTAEKLTAIPIPDVPRDDEEAIADFLDEQTSRIDTLIGKQTQLIDTLRERRQALILRAVTKGLDSKARLRPSGLGWAGDVPVGWSVANIRRYAAMKTGHTPSRSTPEYWTDCTIPWVTLADVWQLRDGRATYLQEDTQTRISELGLANSAAELLPAGTVVLSRTASVGFSGIMPVPMATSQDYWNWVCGPALLPTFLLATFRAMRDEFRSLMIGSTHQTIYQPIAAAMSIVVPPIDEQREIVSYLDRQAAQIDALISKAQDHIALAKERRAALITAALTGQIDVRTAGRAATVAA